MRNVISELMQYGLDDLVVSFSKNSDFRKKILQLERIINSNHANFDNEIANSLNQNEIEIIVKFLTILDREFRSMRRLSVSPIPYLMQRLEQLDPSLHAEIVTWVFTNRHVESVWIPNGKFQPTHHTVL